MKVPRVEDEPGLEGVNEHRFVHEHYEVRVVEVEARREGGPTFVLIHGIGVSSRYFAPLADLLAEHGRVIVFDLPGHGGLPKPEGKLYVEGFAAVVRTALNALGVEDAVLVGHSMGAQVAVELSAAEPHRSRAAVLVGPVVPAGRRKTSSVLADFVASCLHERLPSAMRSIQGYIKASPWWVVEVFPAMLNYPIEHRIRFVKGPLHIVYGELDRICTGDWVEELASAAEAADVTVSLVEGASHQLIVDDAAAVARAALAAASSQGSHG